MPTGYTACIADDVSFEKFVMGCARAFGALVLMRDDPSDAPIPEAFEPSNYHVNALAEARRHREGVINMSDAMAEEAAQEQYEKACRDFDDCQRRCDELRAKYTAMLAKVRSWKAPTEDHEGLKRFMQEQITESIDFDCRNHLTNPRRLTGDEWRQQQIEKSDWDIAYHTKHNAEEIERANSRTQWVRDLRASLA